MCVPYIVMRIIYDGYDSQKQNIKKIKLKRNCQNWHQIRNINFKWYRTVSIVIINLRNSYFIQLVKQINKH